MVREMGGAAEDNEGEVETPLQEGGQTNSHRFAQYRTSRTSSRFCCRLSRTSWIIVGVVATGIILALIGLIVALAILLRSIEIPPSIPCTFTASLVLI